MKDLSTIKLTDTQKRDIQSYCKTNNIEDVEKFVKECFRQGFDVKKYGLLSDDNPSKPVEVQEKEVIREIRVEVPVEVIKEVEIIKEVVVEKPVEVIKEVVKEIPVEKIVTKTEYVTDDTKVNELIKKIEELESKEPEVIEKIVEVTKEVIVEKIIEKNNDDKMKMLQETLQSLRKELNLKNEKIKQLEQSLKDLESLATSKGAVFLKNSNLNENL
jgi:hypothetical protein